jgi:hypothetical protein
MTGDDVLWHQAGINSKGEPFVQLILGTKVIAQMTVPEARDHGMAIVEAAEAAETDAFVFEWVTKHVGAGPQQAAGLLVDFRKYRSEITGKRHGATSSRDWVGGPDPGPEGQRK